MNGFEIGKWRQTRRTFLAFLLVGMLLGGGFAAYRWQGAGVVVVEGAILCLASGLWITEKLIGIFTRVQRANGTAIVLIFSLKILWWATLFWAARHLPPGYDGAVGLGIGIFLLTVLLAALKHYGMPRISDGNSPNDP